MGLIRHLFIKKEISIWLKVKIKALLNNVKKVPECTMYKNWGVIKNLKSWIKRHLESKIKFKNTSYNYMGEYI